MAPNAAITPAVTQIAFSIPARHNQRHLKPETKISQPRSHAHFALAFGLFLSLCIWKFGNPIILDQKVSAPVTAADFLYDAWPPHWAPWILLPFTIIGGLFAFQRRLPLRTSKWLWLLPLLWFAWQLFSALQTVDVELTSATLWQFGGCVACYFLGLWFFARDQLIRWLIAGVLVAFVFCLIRAVEQRLFEYPQNYQMLVEGERAGWTNFPPAVVVEMKNGGVIIFTNGMEAANPLMLAKFARGRVCGTLVYPNALAELVLLLWPVSLMLAFGATKNFRPVVRWAAIGMVVFLGGGAFFWSGSKLGWLIAIGLAGLLLLRLDWPRKMKFAAVTAVLVIGLGIFAVRFHHYFAAGATSAGARFDYWRAAVQTVENRPLFGTGPGTFQRPYARLKSPDSEMARLAHNDFLEQFSDSGIPGGAIYLAWIILSLATIGKVLWRSDNHFILALFIGLLGWFIQGLGEFGLYVPALAWTAFTLLGCLSAQAIRQQSA